MADDTQENNITEPSEPGPQPMPDVGDLLFIGVMSILLFARPDFLFQDTSIGWHLVTGKYIFETHSIPYHDLFSYTFPDKAWVAYEWLFDLICYCLTLLGGMNLLAVAISALIALVLVKLYDLCRQNDCSLGLATFVSIIGIFASSVHWLARPHIITFLAVYLFSSTLESFYRGNITGKRLLAILIPTMVLWVNCHPAFLLGLVLTGTYLGVSVLAFIKDRGTEFAAPFVEKIKWLAIALASIFAASLLNPYFLNLYSYILHYLKGKSVLAETDEFKSPVFHGDVHSFCLEILLALLIVGLSVSKKRLSGPYLCLLLIFLHLSLSAVRNIPLFAIITVPAIGLLLSSTVISDKLDLSRLTRGKFGASLAKFKSAFSEFDIQEKQCKMRILSILFVLFVTVAALSGGSLFGNQILSSGFNREKVAAKTLDYIKEHKLAYDRGFNYDNWGGLIRYQLGQRVFIDDRADFYGEEFYQRYGAVVQVEPGWQKTLDNLKINWILMPKNARLTEPLKASSAWSLACQDEASVLFIRKSSDSTTP